MCVCLCHLIGKIVFYTYALRLAWGLVWDVAKEEKKRQEMKGTKKITRNRKTGN